MKLLVFVLFSVCVIKAASAGCCYREPCVLKPSCVVCYQVPVYSGEVTCDCDCQPTSNALCNCGTPCSSCFRDTSDPCSFCEKKRSPVCSCLAALEGEECSCGCKKSFVYFPEVEYPNTIIEMNPFYFTNCWNY